MRSKVVLALLASASPLVVAGVLAIERTSARATVTLLVALGASWMIGVAHLLRRNDRSLRTLTSALSAVREGDYAVRPRTHESSEPMRALLREAELIARSLSERRTDAFESRALVEKIVNELAVAVVLLDEDNRVSFANPRATKLVRRQLVGKRLDDVGLEACLHASIDEPIELEGIHLQVQRTPFRSAGRPHTLLVLSDIERSLRREQREAWREVVAVLGHEINNSLTPIASLARMLQSNPSLATASAQEALQVIAQRSEGLAAFVAGYARVAKLPPPTTREVGVLALIRRVVRLEDRLTVEVRGTEEARVRGDEGQLEQALMNLVRNAVDASLETGGRVRVALSVAADVVIIEIEDEGAGPPPAERRFLPYFTTKPGGSGIGLALTREIIEGHGGRVWLLPKERGSGSSAGIELPLLG